MKISNNLMTSYISIPGITMDLRNIAQSSFIITTEDIVCMLLALFSAKCIFCAQNSTNTTASVTELFLK